MPMYEVKTSEVIERRVCLGVEAGSASDAEDAVKLRGGDAGYVIFEYDVSPRGPKVVSVVEMED